MITAAKISLCFVILAGLLILFGFGQVLFADDFSRAGLRKQSRRTTTLFIAAAGAMVLAVLTQQA